MVKNSTAKTLQKKLGYNNNIIRLIHSFMVITHKDCDNNKKILMRDLTGFAALYDLYEDFTCFDITEFRLWEEVKEYDLGDFFIKNRFQDSEGEQLDYIKEKVKSYCLEDGLKHRMGF